LSVYLKVATYSDIFINHPVIEDIVLYLEKYYQVGKRKTLDCLNLFEFSRSDFSSRTFVLHKDKNEDWIQLEYELENLYEFDEILRRITEQLEAIALIGYKQTTDGTARFAVFKNGALVRSIVQEYVQSHKEIRNIDNFGSRFSFESFKYETGVLQEIDYDELLNYYDDISKWYEEFGFSWNKTPVVDEYLHLEILNFKN